jgi:hypothetical protein
MELRGPSDDIHHVSMTPLKRGVVFVESNALNREGRSSLVGRD